MDAPESPFALVTREFTFPEYIHWFGQQIQAINDRCQGRTSGLWLEMGTGKTVCSTAVALYKKLHGVQHTLVIGPPILIRQWVSWLRSIKPELTVIAYRGTPKERAELSLDVDFVVVGIQIFKKEYRRFHDFYKHRSVFTIVDEATILASIKSDSHEKVFDFTAGRDVQLLSGTPANKPGDVYGLMKFTAPGKYRNLKHFENLHVEERDFYKNPSKWQNLDELKANLMENSSRILLKDIYPNLDTPLYAPLPYDLEPAHQSLYNKLAEEELLKLPDGGKVDATSANRLRHALGQIVVNYDTFSGDPSKVSAAVEMIEQKLDELGNGKLIVFADYRMTVRQLCRRLQKHNFLPINSEVTPKQKDSNLEAFVKDTKVRGLVIQFVSGGKGLDGLQHVCNHCLFIEPCQQPRDFHQAVARLHRLGQSKKVIVYMATAAGTLQVRGFKNLLENDDLVNQVVTSATSLRSEIFGK